MREPVKRLQLYEKVKSDIASGVYPSGSFLPNELELADKYGYARNTVRPALAMLEDDKIIESLKGRGRRICPANTPKAKVPLTFLLPCPDYINEKFSDTSIQTNRRILNGVLQIAFEYDCRVETVPVSPTNNMHDIDWRKLDFVNADSKLVVNGEWYKDLFPLLRERGCRVAFIGSHVQKEDEDFINSCFHLTINTFDAAETAVKHLFRQSCRRIALFHRYISSDLAVLRKCGKVTTLHDLQEEHLKLQNNQRHYIAGGYFSGLMKCGLAFAAWHEFPEEHMELQEVKKQLKDFYKKSGGFDGLFIDASIILDLHLHNLYQDIGLDENIKIVVSSDLGNKQGCTPHLSGLAFPFEDVGRIAAQHLLAPEFSPGKQLINCKLIERESTAAFSKREQFVLV